MAVFLCLRVSMMGWFSGYSYVVIILLRMSSFVQTSRSPLNNSRFKQLYSFPRANRFSSQGFVSKAPYYDNKVTALGSRATSFGYGNKFTLENKEKVPPPNHYKKDGYFENSVEKRKGYSFNHDSKKGLINEVEIGKIPGPGKYQPTADKHDFKRVSYSFRGKFQDPLSRNQNPLGPGQYSTISDINGQGKYSVSKYRDSGCGKIGNSRRFDQTQTLSPGPGKYEDGKVTSLNNSGTYFYSNFRTTKANAFAHSARKHIAEPTISPGPGAYIRFSEFPRVGRR